LPDEVGIGAEDVGKIGRIHPGYGKGTQDIVERRMMPHPNLDTLFRRLWLYRQGPLFFDVYGVGEVLRFVDAFTCRDQDAVSHCEDKEGHEQPGQDHGVFFGQP
jgi:hypothetical protein